MDWGESKNGDEIWICLNKTRPFFKVVFRDEIECENSAHSIETEAFAKFIAKHEEHGRWIST